MRKNETERNRTNGEKNGRWAENEIWAFACFIRNVHMPNDTNMNASPSAIQSPPSLPIIIGSVIIAVEKRTCRKPSNIEK